MDFFRDVLLVLSSGLFVLMWMLAYRLYVEEHRQARRTSPSVRANEHAKGASRQSAANDVAEDNDMTLNQRAPGCRHIFSDKDSCSRGTHP